MAGISFGGLCILIGSQATGWTMGLTWEAMAYPFLTSLEIAIVFEVFPVLRAARFDPIIAVRSA